MRAPTTIHARQNTISPSSIGSGGGFEEFLDFVRAHRCKLAEKLGARFGYLLGYCESLGFLVAFGGYGLADEVVVYRVLEVNDPGDDFLSSAEDLDEGFVRSVVGSNLVEDLGNDGAECALLAFLFLLVEVVDPVGKSLGGVQSARSPVGGPFVVGQLRDGDRYGNLDGAHYGFALLVRALLAFLVGVWLVPAFEGHGVRDVNCGVLWRGLWGFGWWGLACHFLAPCDVFDGDDPR